MQRRLEVLRQLTALQMAHDIARVAAENAALRALEEEEEALRTALSEAGVAAPAQGDDGMAGAVLHLFGRWQDWTGKRFGRLANEQARARERIIAAREALTQSFGRSGALDRLIGKVAAAERRDAQRRAERDGRSPDN